MADWDEIKRLAADFQRAQLSSTILRLSERNCIEIVQKLVDQELLDIIYTTDGKEYLTHQELVKEIREELLVRGGRVNLVELQSTLNVDFSHIETKVNEIVRNDKSLHLILGQLIDQSYIDSLAEEINDALQEQGQLTLAQLAKNYDLPGDFLFDLIRNNLGTTITGQIDDLDRNILFTDAFVNRHRAIIRGAFSALTRPCTLSTILNHYNLQEKLFHTILEELLASSRLAGTIAGGRQYIPDIYTRTQNEWVDNFLKQNGYLEYDSLTRLGISDPKNFIKKRFKSNSLQFLSSCCIGKQLEERIEAEIDEALSTGGWLDIQPSLPSICTTNDANQLLTRILKGKSGVRLFCDSVVVSDTLIATCQKSFDGIVQERAEKVALTNPSLLMPEKGKAFVIAEDHGSTKEDRKDQRRKKASVGKSGGGTQGREVRTKSVKKKGQRGRDRDADNSDDEGVASSRGHHQETEFLKMEDIEEELRKVQALQDCPEELITDLAANLHRPLNKQFLEVAKSVFLQSAGGASGSARRKTHGDLSEKVHTLWSNIKMFEKSLKHFGDDTRGHMVKHMLKTVCADVSNLVFSTVAADHMVALPDTESLNVETRAKILTKIEDEKVRPALTRLHGSLNGKSLEDFLTQLEAACDQDCLDINLKKADKKKERQILFNHRHALTEQLRQESDPALVLHLASVVLFQVFTQSMLHAPGRCVPQVIAFIKMHMTADTHSVLAQCQDLVVKQLRLQNDKAQGDAEDWSADISRELQDLVPRVKEIASTVKKSTTDQNSEA